MVLSLPQPYQADPINFENQPNEKSITDSIGTKRNVLGMQANGDKGDIIGEYSLFSLGKRGIYKKPKLRLRLTINPNFKRPHYWYPLGKRIGYDKHTLAAKRKLILRMI